MKYQSFGIELNDALAFERNVGALPRQILQAQQRALGTLRRRLVTEAKRDIGAEYNLPASRIAQGLSIRNTSDGLVLAGAARGVNAEAFGATWVRYRQRYSKAERASIAQGATVDGARFAIKRGRPRETYYESFIGKGKNGARLVFIREGKKRLPIRGIYGPSIGQMLKHGRRPERLAEFAIRTLQSEQKRLLG